MNGGFNFHRNQSKIQVFYSQNLKTTDQKMSDQKMSERSKEKNRENDRKKTSRKALADFDQGLFQTFF